MNFVFITPPEEVDLMSEMLKEQVARLNDDTFPAAISGYFY